MKKPVQRLLMLFLVLYLFSEYNEFKKGLMEGYFQEKKKPAKVSVNYSDHADTYSSYFLPIIKIY